jgi:DNA-binding Xre family transcriptional regulator
MNTDTDTYPLFVLLKERGIGIKALARETGIDKGTSQRVFRLQPITFTIAWEIAKCLDVIVDEIFEDSSESPRCIQQVARKDKFILPPYPRLSGLRQNQWEERYGKHKDAPQRRAEAEAKR